MTVLNFLPAWVEILVSVIGFAISSASRPGTNRQTRIRTAS